MDDSGASIGKRYARNDELGTPFGVTIDFACKRPSETVSYSIAEMCCFTAIKNGTITLRDRDTTAQRIGKIDEVVETLAGLSSGSTSWEQACERLQEYSGEQDA